MKVSQKTENAKPAKRSKIVLYRLLMVLALDIIGVSILISIKKVASRENYFVFTALPVLTVVFAVLAVLALAYVVVTKAKRISTAETILTPMMLLGTMLCGLFICAMYKNISLQKIILGLIAVTVLYFVYYLYKRSFFLYAVYSAATLLLLRLLSGVTFFGGTASGAYVAIQITALVVGVAAVLFVLMAKGKNGTLAFGKYEVCLYETQHEMIPLVVTTGLLLLGAALSFLTVVAATYVSIVLLISFLVITIIYTIKMI